MQNAKRVLFGGSSSRSLSAAAMFAALMTAGFRAEAQPLRTVGTSWVPINLGRKTTRPSKKTNAQLQRASTKARNRAKHKARA